jgi:hypothetical protein
MTEAGRGGGVPGWDDPPAKPLPNEDELQEAAATRKKELLPVHESLLHALWKGDLLKQ